MTYSIVIAEETNEAHTRQIGTRYLLMMIIPINLLVCMSVTRSYVHVYVRQVSLQVVHLFRNVTFYFV